MLHERFKWGQAIGLLGEAIASDNPQVALKNLYYFRHVIPTVKSKTSANQLFCLYMLAVCQCLVTFKSKTLVGRAWNCQVMFRHCSHCYLIEHDEQVTYTQSNICCFTTLVAAFRHC